MTGSLLLRSARLPGKPGLVDVGIRDGIIEAIRPAGPVPLAPDPSYPTHDLEGQLLLPAFADGHVHLDKTFLGCPWRPHRPGSTIAARIAAEREERETLPVPLEARASLLLDRMIAFGTLALRCHVDIDEALGLSHLETLMALRDEYRDRIDIQFVAFPQSGITGQVPALLDEALRSGATVIGGLDPAGIDAAIDRHLDVVFGLADRHDCRVDIHLHDPGTLGTFELRQIAARTEALGLQGRVAVSHAFALGMVDDHELGRTATALARAGVAIMTNGPGSDAIPPVGRLLAAGVTVFVGSDNIRDAWSPYGNGDLLDRAALVGYRSDLRSDAGLNQAFDLITANSRSVLGLDPLLIEVGAQADLVALDAEDVAEAVAVHPTPRTVFRRGRLVASSIRSDSGAGQSGERLLHPE